MYFELDRSYVECFLFSDRTQRRLSNCIPPGYHVIKSTGDGNCLFNSISIALCGDESLGAGLRLLAVLHGIGHFQHYLQMVNACIHSGVTLYKLCYVIAFCTD